MDDEKIEHLEAAKESLDGAAEHLEAAMGPQAQLLTADFRGKVFVIDKLMEGMGIQQALQALVMKAQQEGVNVEEMAEQMGQQLQGGNVGFDTPAGDGDTTMLGSPPAEEPEVDEPE